MKPATTAFQAARFLRLLRAHWAEQRRSYGLFWLVVMALHVLLMVILLTVSHGKGGQTEVQNVVFWCGLIASGAVFAGLYFSALKKTGAALVLLTRPATTLEKWLLAALFALLVWPLAYTLSATIINLFAGMIGYQWHAMYNAANGYTPPPDWLEFSLFVPFFTSWHIAILLLYAGTTGFVMLGSLYFNKNSTIKTAVAAFVLFLLTFLLFYIYDSIGFRLELDALSWWDSFAGPTITSTRRAWANILFWLVTPTLVWICAFLALREKDLA